MIDGYSADPILATAWDGYQTEKTNGWPVSSCFTTIFDIRISPDLDYAETTAERNRRSSSEIFVKQVPISTDVTLSSRIQSNFASISKDERFGGFIRIEKIPPSFGICSLRILPSLSLCSL
jgi:hypothetical protein